MMSDDVRFKINLDIGFREINGKLMFILPEEDELFEANSTGKLIWHHMLEKKSLHEIYLEVSKNYGVDIDLIKSDVDAYIESLIHQKIISLR